MGEKEGGSERLSPFVIFASFPFSSFVSSLLEDEKFMKIGQCERTHTFWKPIKFQIRRCEASPASVTLNVV